MLQKEIDFAIYFLINPLEYMFPEEMDFVMHHLINPLEYMSVQLYVFKSIM